MADYAETTTVDTPDAERATRNLAILTGQTDLTNYNQTGAEITDLTKHFKSVLRVICDGLSANGYIIRWDTTDKCFHAFYPTHLVVTDDDTPDGEGVAMYFDDDGTLGERVLAANAGDADSYEANPALEVANDVDVGEINWIAMGIA